MSDIFFGELDIPAPNHNFNINNLPRADFITAVSGMLADYFAAAGPAIVFIYGDTNTTAAAAIAAKKAGNLLVHFEAGVRTGEADMPEETNRVLADGLSDINLCCTARNYATMLSEDDGSGRQLYLTGDLMLDAFKKIAASNKKMVAAGSYVACTIHRAANINHHPNLHQIIEGLNQIHTDIPVVVPVHPNTRKKMTEAGCKPLFNMLDPLGYPDMKSFLAGSSYVITDSGGTCREAYFLQKPAVVVMDNPFWPEILENGCALSSPASKDALVKNFFRLATLRGNFEEAIFGDGNAAGKIKEILAAIHL